MRETTGKTTFVAPLLLYSELTPAAIRTVQRKLRQQELFRIAPGVVTSLREKDDWPALVARERVRLLAAMFPGAVISHRSAFYGGGPQEGVMFLTHAYTRRVELPGLTVQLTKGSPALAGDTPVMGRALYFPSEARMLLENLSINKGKIRKAACQQLVKERLIAIYEARGQEALSKLRDSARALAPALELDREFGLLDTLIGGVLGTRQASMVSAKGKALIAAIPYDANRLALFEKLAQALRSIPLKQPASILKSEQGRINFAFLESYFSNFIEGVEFEVEEARAFVLEGQPIVTRHKESHDLIGVFRQAFNRGWANQTLAPGEPVLVQLRERHADQMKERSEVQPGEFKMVGNRAGSTEFVAPRLVCGTLIEGSTLLPTVPAGVARALLAMFLVSEVHPFKDGNGRLARLVMNAELSVVDSCRIIVPTLFREEYIDCLRVLTRQEDPQPFLAAMQKIHEWSASFDYEDLDQVIAEMKACNAFERRLGNYRLGYPPRG